MAGAVVLLGRSTKNTQTTHSATITQSAMHIPMSIEELPFLHLFRLFLSNDQQSVLKKDDTQLQLHRINTQTHMPISRAYSCIVLGK